jgi:hypothetical protein
LIAYWAGSLAPAPLGRLEVSKPDSRFSADIQWKSERHEIGKSVVWVCRYADILSREYDSAARPIQAATDWVSVANLALWRSPRGIDYHIGPHSISIWPEDKSGRAEISLISGRCIHASGVLAALQHSVVKWEHISDSSTRPFLTANRQDLLLPMRLLKGLWGAWANPVSGTFTYAPTSTVSLDIEAWYIHSNNHDPKYAMHEFAATVMLKPGLRCSILLDRQLIDPATNTIRDEVHLECRNISKRQQLLQVQRVAPVYGDSHSCWFGRFIPNRGHFDDAGIPQVAAGGGDAENDFPPTLLLPPNGYIFIDYLTTPGSTNTAPSSIRFHYGDGYVSTTFNLFPHKSDGVVH